LEIRDACWTMLEDYANYMNDFLFHLALAHVHSFVNKLNAFFHEHQPWKRVKHDVQQAKEIFSVLCHALKSVAVILHPIMPMKMEQLLTMIGHASHASLTYDQVVMDRWNDTFILGVPVVLFQKPTFFKEQQEEETVVKNIGPVKESVTIGELAIDTFKQVCMVVGLIERAEMLEGSKKLLKLSVDCGQGHGIRTILSGVREWYTPESLVGMRAAFVVNLKPRVILGIESHGMMLCVKDEEGKVLPVSFPSSVIPGTPLQ
ncbi:MAG: class I tRNA ligase family protein, partial [Candidatus Babeliales bacterium]